MTLYELIDLNRRETVHVWHLPPLPGAVPVYPFPDGSLFVPARWSVMRVDACSNVEWRKELESMVHHSIERDADGNFWMPTRSGRRRLFNRKDELLKLSPAGDVLARISLTDALARNGYRHLLYGMHDYGDSYFQLHVNDVEPVLRDGPFWRRGDLFVSLRANSVVLLYRPVTGEVVWLQQGPWLHQHDVDVVGDSEISVFSNNAAITRGGGHRVLGANEVYVHDFATGEARSPWREAMRRHDVRTVTMGGAVLSGDGGLMVEENDYGGSCGCRRTVRYSGRTSIGPPTVGYTGWDGAATWRRTTARRSRVRLRLRAVSGERRRRPLRPGSLATAGKGNAPSREGQRSGPTGGCRS